MSSFQAFTLKPNGGGILHDLKTKCGASPAFDVTKDNKEDHPKIVDFIGLWDTGATGTMISPNVVDKLSLKPIGKAKVYHANGDSIVNRYAVNIFLPNKVAFQMVQVTEGKLSGMDILIGMDIITRGDFSITNVNGHTTFTYRFPSIKEIDYVKEAEAEPANTTVRAQPVTNTKKAGRNEPCPCGSGEKYKKCHGKPKRSFFSRSWLNFY